MSTPAAVYCIQSACRNLKASREDLITRTVTLSHKTTKLDHDMHVFDRTLPFEIVLKSLDLLAMYRELGIDGQELNRSPNEGSYIVTHLVARMNHAKAWCDACAFRLTVYRYTPGNLRLVLEWSPANEPEVWTFGYISTHSSW